MTLCNKQIFTVSYSPRNRLLTSIVICTVSVSTTCDCWRLYEGHCLRQQLRHDTCLHHQSDWLLHQRPARCQCSSLQNVLNSAARSILRKHGRDHITADIRDLLQWLPVQQRIEYKMCVLVYTVSTHLPLRVLHPSCSISRTKSRSAVHGNLIISYCRTKRYVQRSFVFSGPALWNSLPLTVITDSVLCEIKICHVL